MGTITSAAALATTTTKPPPADTVAAAAQKSLHVCRTALIIKQCVLEQIKGICIRGKRPLAHQTRQLIMRLMDQKIHGN